MSRCCIAASSVDVGATPDDGCLLCRGTLLVTLIFLGRPGLLDLSSEDAREDIEEDIECADMELIDDDVRDIVE